jgi:hypothetical protein
MHRVQFSMAHPGAEGKQATEIVPMKDGSDIQSKPSTCGARSMSALRRKTCPAIL